MKTKAARIASLVLVAGLLIAIPASTQMLGSRNGSEEGAVDLGMLVTVNRLELSQEQMIELKDLIDGLLAEKEAMEGLKTQFEEDMIAFNGSSEELDERLAAFRESQAEAATILRASAAEALDGAKDLLSINQGEVIREALQSKLKMGIQAISGTRQGLMIERRGIGRGQHAEVDMERQMLEQAMRGRMQEMQARGVDRDPGEYGLPQDARGLRGTRGQRFEALPEGMREAVRARLESVDGEVPEARLERLERLEERTSDGSDERFDSPGLEVGGGIRGQANRVAMGSSMRTRSDQGFQSDHLGLLRGTGSAELLEVLEQVSEILELKLEALQ